ncbi:MAG: DUF1292 domain-containing protein [Bacilli bacterium]|nr:DUF1292 domain-containing protein [Bacilli bacterium]
MEDTNFDVNKEKIKMEKDGKTIECDVLFTFECEETMKAYVGYTDNSIASNGRKNIYVSAFDPFKEEMELENITDKRELEMIGEVLEKIDKESKN